MLVFACLSPHAPLFLPKVGSKSDRQKVKKTTDALESLAPKLKTAKPDIIIISSPHEDWGVKVPLHFLIPNNQFSISNFQSILNFKFQILNSSVLPVITSLDSPYQHYLWGKKIAAEIPKNLKVAWIASGDMSHVLKEDGPYGFKPEGQKYDQELMKLLKKKDIKGILGLDSNLTEQAAECGLRSFCLLLGALEQEKQNWQPQILSYEFPFGVGYLVAQLL